LLAPGVLHRLLQWATLVSKDGKKGSNLWVVRRANTSVNTIKKALLHTDSWTVAMEAGNR